MLLYISRSWGAAPSTCCLLYYISYYIIKFYLHPGGVAWLGGNPRCFKKCCHYISIDLLLQARHYVILHNIMSPYRIYIMHVLHARTKGCGQKGYDPFEGIVITDP
jgi:hypothetical protein